mmetsp:Transcript_1905/g.2687  ORF Transcript_1905/g.2687 Transcript_1905/m.2687 type:complete len:91 (+) Transcript_1905:974-1246(+)
MVLTEELFGSDTSVELDLVKKMATAVSLASMDSSRFILVLEGSQVEIDGQSLNKGDMVFIPRGAKYTMLPKSDKALLLSIKLQGKDYSLA